MKKLLFLLLVLLLSTTTFSQSFQTDILSQDSSFYFYLTKTNEENGNFYTFYTQYYDSTRTLLHNLSIDGNGNIINDTVLFQDSLSLLTYNVIKISGNQYVFAAASYNNYNKVENGRIFITDSAFNIIYESQLPFLRDSSMFGIPYIYQDFQSNLIFGWIQDVNNGNWISNSYFLKTNLQLDSLAFLSIPLLTNQNLIDDTVIQKYVITPCTLTSLDTNIILFYNYDFSLDTMVKWPNFISNPPVTSQNSYLRLSIHRFVYASQTINTGNNRGMGAYLYNDLNYLSFKNIGVSYNATPAEHFSLSKINDKYFYFGGETNWTYGPWSNDSNSIVLVKMDTNLNIVWTRYFPEDLFHNPYNVNTTNDKGCLISGYTNSGHGVFLIKIDSLGNLTWSHGIDVQEQVALVYPNPAKDVLYVQNGLIKQKANFTLFDLEGKQVFNKSLQPLVNNYNISELPSGVYIYRIASKDKLWQRGKIVKE